MAKKRLTWVDAAKGLLMIFVVIGHYPVKLDQPWITFIYWFHMPAFFILSGLFFKPVPQNERILPYVKKRFMQLMIPYFFFLIVITALRYILAIASHNFTLNYLRQDVFDLLLGGRFAGGSYGVIWFITTLFAAYILFLLITRYFKPIVQIIIVAIFYAIAQWEGQYVENLPGTIKEASLTIIIPWNLDVALLAVVYLGIGYYLRRFIKEIHWALWIASTLFITYHMYLTWHDRFDYHLSLKFIRYGEPIYDLLIPFTFVISILGIIQWITKKIRLKIFEFIEKHSIVIMYLHISVDKFANDFVSYGLFGYTMFGLIIPIIISILMQRLVPFAPFLLGQPHVKKVSP